MKFFGNILIFFGLFVIFQFSGISGQSRFELGSFFVGLLIATPLLGIGLWFIGKYEQERQRTAEAKAGTVLDAVKAGSTTEDFFLYLRPFDSTNAYRLSDTHLNLFSWELWERDGFDDMERLIARALRPTANFIALGRPGEHRGAARIPTTESEWQREVELLAESAKLIVVIPANKPGTLWEISRIKENGYIAKTIFVMPPSNHSFYVTSKQDVADEWHSAQQACAEFGVFLPDHVGAGELFTLNDQNSVRLTLPLPAPDAVAWMTALQRLIDDT